MLTLVAGTFLLDLSESARFDECFFETASALGTVALSMGITASLSSMGKVLIVLMIYAGRVGPLTLAIALLARSELPPDPSDADVAVRVSGWPALRSMRSD